MASVMTSSRALAPSKHNSACAQATTTRVPSVVLPASGSSLKAAAPCLCSCGRVMCNGNHGVRTQATAVAQAPAATTAAPAKPSPTDLGARHQTVLQHFPAALSADDYITRVEIALAGYGFTGDNTIAMSNLCRDESCMVLEDKIEAVFGSCFSTHGLGGVLTCGVIGIKAGLSHSPVCPEGKERYVFFSFPHIAIDSDGNVGGISRPNRPSASSACGALIAVTGQLKSDGLDASCKPPGVHDPLEPEYSILKQRLARRLKHEGAKTEELDLVAVTKAAERTITSDLEYLIEKAVDPKKADYAVFTGVQIHNWASDLNDASVPSLEFVNVGKSYVVIDGVKSYLDVHKVPALSPRQIKMLAALSTSGSTAAPDASATASTSGGMIQEVPRDYLLKRLGGAASNTTVNVKAPNWKEYVRTTYAEAHPHAPKMDEKAFEDNVANDGRKDFFSSFTPVQ